MKVVVIFHRLGPYHFARLRAAGRQLPVVAIETSGTDVTYAWDKIAGADGFERMTLFADADAQTQPTREVTRRLTAALDQIQPKVVVVPGWSDPAALAALQWCSQHQIPSVMMSESTAWDETRSVWREAIKRRIVGLGSAALAGGTAHRDYLIQLGMPAERIFLGYDAVDNGYFSAKAEEWRKQKVENGKQTSEGGAMGAEKRNQPNELTSQGHHESGTSENKNKFPLSTFPISAFPNVPLFLASARFIEKKNLPRLIQAYARYRELASKVESGKQKIESPVTSSGPQPLSPQCGEGDSKTGKQKSEDKNEFQLSAFSVSDLTPWNLVLLGDGELRPDLCRLISDLRLRHSVLLPGFIQYPELPAYYARAGAFIHASTTEQWGLVVNEAMASSLPVLVSNRCGCAPDLVQEGVNGFTFDPYNVEELAELMLKISAFHFPLSAFGSQSQRIIANWGPERFASGLKSAVDKAIVFGPVKAPLGQRLILNALLLK